MHGRRHGGRPPSKRDFLAWNLAAAKGEALRVSVLRGEASQVRAQAIPARVAKLGWEL